MKRPTQAEIDAAKAECLKRFGHDDMLGIPLRAPVDAYLILARMKLADASKFQDANIRSSPNAAAEVMETRVLWPDQEVVTALRDKWGMLDADIAGTAGEMMRALGYIHDDAAVMVEPLSVGTAPPGLASSPREVSKAVEALYAASPGAALWSIVCNQNGLALVVRAPHAGLMLGISRAAYTAIAGASGSLTATLDYVRDLVVWAPGILGGDAKAALDRHMDEKPWRARQLTTALLKIGGAGAAERAEFL